MKDIVRVFAENLRESRRAQGLTQRELAEKIGYSEKAISKWESGVGMPPSVMLPALAKVLETSIDALMEERSRLAYDLGIDGGGTKTEFLLADESGRILSRTTLGGCNPNDVGIERTLEILEEGIRKTCGDHPYGQISVFAGIAGGITGENQREIAKFLERFRFAHCRNGSDAQNAVAAALDSSDGVAVILGTGAIAFAKQGGRTTRYGGYGHLLGDGGSGYALGRDAIRAALAHEDGSGEETLLRAMILERCGCETLLSGLGAFYDGGKRTIASYAPLVWEASEQGDGVANRILDENLREVVTLIRQACRTFEDGRGVPVALCGGLVRQKDLLPRLRAVLEKDPVAEQIFVCRRSMAEGALLLARQQREGENPC